MHSAGVRVQLDVLAGENCFARGLCRPVRWRGVVETVESVLAARGVAKVRRQGRNTRKGHQWQVESVETVRQVELASSGV